MKRLWLVGLVLVSCAVKPVDSASLCHQRVMDNLAHDKATVGELLVLTDFKQLHEDGTQSEGRATYDLVKGGAPAIYPYRCIVEHGAVYLYEEGQPIVDESGP